MHKSRKRTITIVSGKLYFPSVKFLEVHKDIDSFCVYAKREKNKKEISVINPALFLVFLDIFNSYVV